MDKGSIALMYSTLRRRDALLLVPAVLLAVVAGVVPALMAKIIGVAFDAFTVFNPGNLPVSQVSQASKQQLREATLRSVWQLCVLGAATMLLSTVMIATWIILGEKVARGWRIRVYKGMSEKDMKWFDVDLKSKAGNTEGSTSVGAGGLMAKFARETDEIRIATGQTFGQTIETLSTVVASLVLAFISNWSLTLVILASLPLTAILVGLVQSKAEPLHTTEMESMARASNVLERGIQCITTIKAFSAEEKERGKFMVHIHRATAAWNRLAVIYGARLGLSSGLTLIMFTSGFWYGSSLVQQGKASPADVLTTFWSCLLVGNSIGVVLTTLSLIEMGKISAASLTKLTSAVTGERNNRIRDSVNCVVTMDPPHSSVSSFATVASSVTVDNEKSDGMKSSKVAKRIRGLSSSSSNNSASNRKGPKHTKSILPMRKIRPNRRCHGEVTLQNVTFSYPSRPNDAVLQDVSMYFPCGEITFIVGGSGSGKSTISHLLLQLYDGYKGDIYLDDQDIRYLDAEWTRGQVAGLDQSALIFDMSVRDNVALGYCGKLAEGAIYKANHVPMVDLLKIIDACRMALLHADIQRLEDGYDTLLGSGGIDLSGGQKQRLALARAIIRDPTVLILDECTSALDVKSRVLITSFIRKWRRGRTTIMITHDLSQVEEEDFVYLLQQGKVVEQGYRMDLDTSADAPFSQFVRSQAGFSKKADSRGKTVNGDLDQEDEVQEEMASPTGLDWRATRALEKTQSQRVSIMSKHSRISRWGSTADLSFNHRYESSAPLAPLPAYGKASKRTSVLGHQRNNDSISTISSISSTTSTASIRGLRVLQLPQERQQRAVHEDDTKESLELTSIAASVKRPDVRSRKAWDEVELSVHIGVNDRGDNMVARGGDQPLLRRAGLPAGYIEEDDSNTGDRGTSDRRTILSALRMAWTSQPKKPVLVIGLLASVAGASVQPIFSFVLAKLLATMGMTDQHSEIIRYSLVVLGLAFIDGFVCFARFSLLQYSANVWICSLRDKAFAKVFSQDKAWFDQEENSCSAVLNKIIKDGEDAKSFISRIIGELVVVVFTISIAFIWSWTVSWQLTLAGAALGPVFYLVVLVQGRLIDRFERQNKLQRERVSKCFYSMLHNIRAIRSMSLEGVFWENFFDAVYWVERYGVRSAPLSGFGYGLKDACTYFAQALLFYVGAVLLINGKLQLKGMLTVLNLLLFAVVHAAAIMAFLPGISKSLQAIYDLVTILQLSDIVSSEYQGRATPLIYGSVTFHNVDFSYPSRQEQKVLDGCTFEIRQGERVALVGQSGCGKSTAAALIYRLYEPSKGFILLDNNFKLSNVKTSHLRDNIGVVQQRSDLFDDSIRKNILYGNVNASAAMLERAIKQSCCDDIIKQVDNGLDTVIGDEASNISGGQKQRIALARALVREEAKILILDECTSALDATNQARVAEALLSDNHSRRTTTLIVTHKLEMMKRCDRILVLEKGKVVQSGHFNELIQQRGGAFSKLAKAGEWGA